MGILTRVLKSMLGPASSLALSTEVVCGAMRCSASSAEELGDACILKLLGKGLQRLLPPLTKALFDADRSCIVTIM